MQRPLRIALRFAVVVAAVAALSVALAPSTPTNGPYTSALSDLMIQSATAAPKCANKICRTGSWADGCTGNQGTYCKRTERQPPGGGTGCASFFCPT